MHYKKSGLHLSFSTVMSMWVHNSFKRIISSSNFVAIALLVVLARKDPGTTSPFSSLLDPVTLTCTLFSWPLAGFEKCEYKEGKFNRHKFVISFKVSPNCVFIVLFQLSCMPETLLWLETTPLYKHDDLVLQTKIPLHKQTSNSKSSDSQNEP